MSIYKRGDVWWWRFKFQGRTYRESSKYTNKQLAVEAERHRRNQLRDGYQGIQYKPRVVLTFNNAADAWLAGKAVSKPRSVRIYGHNLAHLKPALGSLLIFDITADDITAYQGARQREGASTTTIRMEVGTLRAVLKKYRRWEAIAPDVEMIGDDDDNRVGVGIALSREQETLLLKACRVSRTEVLYIVTLMAFATGCRRSEIRLRRWSAIDFERDDIHVTTTKTKYGDRHIPIAARLRAELDFWAARFPHRQPVDYVFAVRNPSKAPCRRAWRSAWKIAKQQAGLSCRFHDLRHTAFTRMLEAGIGIPKTAEIMGWSPSTAYEMSKVYGHLGDKSRREAINALEAASAPAEPWAQKVAQSVKGMVQSSREGETTIQ